MHSFLKLPLTFVSRPLRYLIRSEINSSLTLRDQNIQAALQRRALEETIDYVERKMLGVDSVTSAHELLSKALSMVKGDGLVCEFGVFSGKSINHIASHVDRVVYGFDSFEGLPERWRDGFDRGFFKVDRLPKVEKNVVLIKGWFDKTLPEFVKNQTKDVAFLHIDCDLYSSTKVIFENLGGRIKPGCIIVFDEYLNYPGWKDGEIKAFHEFLEAHHLAYEYIGYNAKHEQVAVVIK
ncbi:Demethyldecarbamoylnovobiocin O-methyltransferase [Caballeronia calidae]|uniref:Demethyldecarbamoylnovobiocin O-methyltransferase n=1 Tax=Caballeronia calidae TaxID=1777139 RepID=A0A158CPK9_9BURK|nr:TylF/MycF/NovP-related O-methyltransferase [Caballeronia calidae]SAK84314.1 Demethyldecarbamoylnovobiocin O-methyltransferase [Caballeronia calidae]